MHTTPTLAGGNAKKREISRPFAWVADWRELQLAAAVTEQSTIIFIFTPFFFEILTLRIRGEGEGRVCVVVVV